MWDVISPMLDHSKITKIPLNDPNSQKWEDFGHFLELVHRIDSILHILIELNDLNDLAIVLSHNESFECHKKCLFEWSPQPKTRILTIFLTLVHRIDLILCILIQLNGVHDMTILSLMLDHSGWLDILKYSYYRVAQGERFWKYEKLPCEVSYLVSVILDHSEKHVCYDSDRLGICAFGSFKK